MYIVGIKKRVGEGELLHIIMAYSYSNLDSQVVDTGSHIERYIWVS